MEKLGKDKPAYGHAIILGLLALGFVLSVASNQACDLTARTVSGILNLAGIPAEYASPPREIRIVLEDGALFVFSVSLECSGLLALVVLAVISVFTVGLLKGDLRVKLLWFVSSGAVGLVWNLGRLTSIIAVAPLLGLAMFRFVSYALGPVLDILWVVSMWALAMSCLRRDASA